MIGLFLSRLINIHADAYFHYLSRYLHTVGSEPTVLFQLNFIVRAAGCG